jgi:hypothetical protein
MRIRSLSTFRSLPALAKDAPSGFAPVSIGSPQPLYEVTGASRNVGRATELPG